MKIEILFLSSFFLCAGVMMSCDPFNKVSSPDANYFLKYYGEDGNQEAVDMIVNNDGTVVLLGKSNIGDKHIFVVKVDARGNIIWQHDYGEITDIAKDIEMTLDGNYIILSDYLPTPNNRDIKLTQITKDGIETNTAVYGSPYDDNANALTVLSDGGYIAVGYSEFDWEPSTSIGFDRTSSIFHFRCDKSFNFYDESRWKNFFGSGENNFATKIFQVPAGFYVYGRSDVMHDVKLNDKMNFFYYQLDDYGKNSKGPTFIGGSDGDIVMNTVIDVPTSLLSGSLSVGYSTDNGGASELHVSKLKYPLQFTATDDKQFDQDILAPRQVDGISAAISLMAPQGYLIVSNEKDETGQSNIVLSKINQQGNEIWSTSYGGSKNDNAAAVAELPDGKILILGTIQLDVQLKIALIKVNSKGQFLD